jgi:hypothetical protein
MTLKQTQFWRTWLGRVGSLLCILLFLIIIDAMVAKFREPLTRFSGLPGDRLPVSGPLAEKPDGVRGLIYQTNSPDLQLHFESVQTGFWMGGYLWNGYLIFGPQIKPGGYQLTVLTQKTSSDKYASHFQIQVYNSPRELQRYSKSLVVRHLGINSWSAGLYLCPLIGLVFAIVYYLSHKTESLMAEHGQAEIYRVRKVETAYEISFGLGTNQGIEPGNRLTLWNHQGKAIGSICVQEVFEGHSTAQVDFGTTIRPGFIISRSEQF